MCSGTRTALGPPSPWQGPLLGNAGQTASCEEGRKALQRRGAGACAFPYLAAGWGEGYRGVTFNPFYTKAVTKEHWQAACRHWEFGILAANFFGVKNDEIPTMIDTALAIFARESKHPELITAKLCPLGMSSGAGMSTRIAEQLPDRVIAVGQFVWK